MDYGRLFRRAAQIAWAYKFLILLGILAAFTTSTGSGGTGFSISGDFENGQLPQGMPSWPGFNLLAPFVGDADGMFVAPAMVILFACIALIVAVILYVLGTLARGALISGVDAAETGKATSLGIAWGAAREHTWTLIGIGILPALPALIGGLLGLGGLAVAGNMAYVGDIGRSLAGGLGAFFGIIACILLPLAFVLGLLRTFANRAAMFEGTGVVDSYGRGWNVLIANLGPALVIFIFQILISVALGLLLILPLLVLALCCLLWPVLLLLQGYIAAFFSGVWTLAWREWTGMLPAEKPLGAE